MTVEIRAAVLTVSDRSARGERGDESGPVLAGLLREAGATVVTQEIVSDELGPLAERLRALAEREDVNLPGSPRAVRECFAVIRPVLAHAVAQLAGGDHEKQ